MAETLQDEQLKTTSEKTKIDEVKAYSLADHVWVVSNLDQKVLADEMLSQSKIEIVPNIHTVSENPVSIEKRDKNTLLFVGGFVHKPNVDAIDYFMTYIFDLIREKIPDIRLNIVGDSPPAHIQAMACDNVKVLGYVPETKPYLDSAMVSIAPLRYGAGLKGKVGEALAAGVPLVTTSVGAQGMDLKSGEDCFIADSPEDFAESITQLLLDKDLWQRFALSGCKFMQDQYGYESVKKNLLSFFGSLPQ